MCDQQSLRSACANAQSDQSLCLSLDYSMNVKLLTEHHSEFLSLKRGCTGSSESTLVKMPHGWKSHVTAHMLTIHVRTDCVTILIRVLAACMLDLYWSFIFLLTKLTVINNSVEWNQTDMTETFSWKVCNLYKITMYCFNAPKHNTHWKRYVPTCPVKMHTCYMYHKQSPHAQLPPLLVLTYTYFPTANIYPVINHG